jgi:hypothetical protein
MAKKKKYDPNEPFYFALSIDGEVTEIPIAFDQAVVLYNSLQYYIRLSSKEPIDFLN